MQEPEDPIFEDLYRKSIYSREDAWTEEQEQEEEEEGDEQSANGVIYQPQDILADERREYSAKDEFVYLLYNDILPNFVSEWKGEVLLKKLASSKRLAGSLDSREEAEDHGETEVEEPPDRKSSGSCGSRSALPWKLKFRDETATIAFLSGNTYSGRVSRKMMEGQGIYRWKNGARYKGEFQQNEIQGRGFLEWRQQCWYEGEFQRGLPHGRGTMVVGDYKILYIGQWHMGRKHGNGYCRYHHGDSYDGEWSMGERHGFGLRIYETGARYAGQWKNGLRHGTGSMTWPNGDVYRGQWESGKMEGFGEYIWRSFFNKTLCWPRQASYVGEWHLGMRHGKGVLNFNSLGGAKYKGLWKSNKKHGYGMIIGNNGEIVEDDNLFHEDILTVVRENEEPEAEAGPEVREELDSVDPEDFECDETSFVGSKRPAEASGKIRKLTLGKPEQFPPLWYNICRLLHPESLEGSATPAVASGKCHGCDETPSCSCLLENIQDNAPGSERSVNEKRPSCLTMKARGEQLINNQILEEEWAHNCLIIHMPRLRVIYDTYTKVFSKSPPACKLAMNKLTLWQLWRDCGIHKKLGLAEIDDYLDKNETILLYKEHNPFKVIEFWQFLYALLEVSWHLYVKLDNVDSESTRGKLAGGLHKFLETDVYPNAGIHIGVLFKCYDLLPLYSMYELYRKTDQILTAKKLLGKTCVITSAYQPKESPSFYAEIPEHLLNGINCVTAGDRVTYIPKEKDFLFPKSKAKVIGKPEESDSVYDLLIFQELEATGMLGILSEICPLIKSDDLITNIDYELTFLEFYEVLLEASKRLLFKRKIQEKKSQKAETTATEEMILPKSNEKLRTSQSVDSLTAQKFGKKKKKS